MGLSSRGITALLVQELRGELEPPGS